MDIERVLVTGATGYVGGRLVPALLDAGYAVRCVSRRPHPLTDRPFAERVTTATADVLTGEGLEQALEGIDAAYYLVHSLGSGADFRGQDRRAADNFRRAAAAAGLERIVYLGGLGEATDGPLSEHLASRQEVGRRLAAGPVPTTELRAAIVVGAGSASFEMLRHLTRRLPVMVTPRWVRTRCQPIAIRDVVHYLLAVLEHPEAADRILEIGGPDVLTYEQAMRRYAQLTGLRRRLILPVPVLSPRLSSLWVGLVTPMPSELARPLIEGLVNPVVVRDRPITDLLPDHTPLSFDAAVRAATARGDGDPPPEAKRSFDPPWAG